LSIHPQSKQRQIASVKAEAGGVWNDELPAGSTLEDGDHAIDDDNALASQLRRVIYGPAPGAGDRWYDLPPAGLVDIATAGLAFIAGEAIATGDALAIGPAGTAYRAQRSPAANLYHVAGVALNAALAGGAVGAARIGSKVAARFNAPPSSALNGQIVWLDDNGAASMTAAVAPPSADYQLGILLGADGVTSSPEILFAPVLSALYF